jgi:hypothetical protein
MCFGIEGPYKIFLVPFAVYMGLYTGRNFYKKIYFFFIKSWRFQLFIVCRETAIGFVLNTACCLSSGHWPICFWFCFTLSLVGWSVYSSGCLLIVPFCLFWVNSVFVLPFVLAFVFCCLGVWFSFSLYEKFLFVWLQFLFQWCCIFGFYLILFMQLLLVWVCFGFVGLFWFCSYCWAFSVLAVIIIVIKIFFVACCW